MRDKGTIRKALTIRLVDRVLILRKIKTIVDYLVAGLRLGKGLRSKALLFIMLLEHKLLRINSFVHRVFLKNYGGPVYVRPSDVSEIYEILYREDYWFKEMREANFDVVLDLGAHIGLFTLWIKSKYPHVTVHCYEPDPETFALLQKNTKTLDNVFLHQEAIGNFTGESTFYVDPKRHALSSLRASPGKKPINCYVKALDDVIKMLGKVDLIKFDIEGAELEVFSGSSQVKGVSHLVGEVHGKAVDIRKFTALFPNYCFHFKRPFKKDLCCIVYLHKGTCGS